MIRFDVNTSEISWYTNQLEKMHQSAFPNAVRGTLNGLAFDVKTVTMPKTSDEFDNRNKTFFKANSKVDKANGFNVNSMKSVVGFIPTSSMKNNKAVDELKQQEDGGLIKDRSLIPLSRGRVGGKLDKSVRDKNRLGKIPKDILKHPSLFNVTKNKAKSKKQKFIRTIIEAKKSNHSTVYILGNRYGSGKQTLSRIDFFGSNLKSRKLVIKRTPMYVVQRGRAVRVKATNFMKRASYESALKANDLYIKEAQRQFERYYNS